LSYKVLLISSGQPSLNPRLVKEADALTEAGFEVTVLYAYWNAWGTALDTSLLASKKWRAIRVGGDPVIQPLPYFFSRLLFKSAILFTRLTGSMLFADVAITRSSRDLVREAQRHRADLYIGHNLGALQATVKAAKKRGKPCGFDAEDFHRHEVTDAPHHLAVKLSRCIEDKYLPLLQYLTASSPLIAQAYEQLYPQINTAVVLNTFPKNTVGASRLPKAGGIVKLFWFSQTVGQGRGMEDILAALELQAGHFELHLLGDASEEVRQQFSARIAGQASKIFFHKPIPPEDIMAFATQFDIGIASEKSTPLNRDLCLTNKLFTYIQAGLTIIASDTRAQSALIKQYGIAGEIYHSLSEIGTALQYYQDNPGAMQDHKTHNYQLGQDTLNWETGKTCFLAVIRQTLGIE
jgi:hypothetical protein